MTTVLLFRHGLTEMTGPVLAGWTPGVHLDERGRSQADALAERLRPVPLAAIVSSPLERCQETAQAVAAGREQPGVATDERVGECHYGDWTGQSLKRLAKDRMWQVVQSHPSAAVFPGPEGEALRDVQNRAVGAIRDWNQAVGEHVAYAVCSHGDVIKAVVADALGLHLDFFQRIQIDPGSLTAIRYTETRPFVLRLNDTGGDAAGLVPAEPKQRSRRSPWHRRGRASDAAVGGGSGNA